MPPQKSRAQETKKGLDIQEIIIQKFRTKCRFKALIRLAYANAYWLCEDTDSHEDIEDVRKRVALAVRRQVKKKALLSLADKALLNKPASQRTDAENKHIFKVVSGLKCFKRYPIKVQRKLVATTYFKYFGPGRVLVHQDYEAHAMYFLLSGEVIVTQMVFDEVLQKPQSVEIGRVLPGETFGEVSLLHDVPRTATCTTAGHCEFLILLKEDFKRILQTTIEASWAEIRTAMNAFSYFDHLTEISRREGCLVAKMKTFAVNDIILGDGRGVPNFVYFILTGSCQMIESLQVGVSTRLGRSYYTLHDSSPSKSKSNSSELERGITCVYGSETSQKNKANDEISSSSTCEHQLPRHISNLLNKRVVGLTEKDDGNKPAVYTRDKKRLSWSPMCTNERDSHDYSDVTVKTAILLEPAEYCSESVRLSFRGNAEPTKRIETYFMEVCRFNPGSTFEYDESMRDRRIVARTEVECMLMPKVWLLQHNTGGIWTRIQHYLQKTIPDKKQLFEIFVNERRWEEYRNKVLSEVISPKTVNWTTPHDVPYSIRLQENINV